MLTREAAVGTIVIIQAWRFGWGTLSLGSMEKSEAREGQGFA